MLQILWPHCTQCSWWKPSLCRAAAIRKSPSHRKTQSHVAQSHWIGSETAELTFSGLGSDSMRRRRQPLVNTAVQSRTQLHTSSSTVGHKDRVWLVSWPFNNNTKSAENSNCTIIAKIPFSQVFMYLMHHWYRMITTFHARCRSNVMSYRSDVLESQLTYQCKW